MLIVQGVFRSGTTLLFRLLRQDAKQRCYYEPLHPNLPDHVKDAGSEGHQHAKSSYYSEYQPLVDRHPAGISPPSSLPQPVDRSRDPDLTEYLHLLADSARHPVLQFNRAFWISRRLKEAFPESGFVHVVRDPRAVVWSQLTTPSGQRIRMDWPLVGRLLPLSSGTLGWAFSHHAYFGAYQLDEYFEAGCQLLDSTSDEILQQACARLDATRDAPPYVKALALWGAQVEVCHRHAQGAFNSQYQLVRYEDLCRTSTEVLRTVYRLQDRSVPRTVQKRAEQIVAAHSSPAWRRAPSAERRFRAGIRRARISNLMSEIGYDLS